jgi:hypothetical protein
VELLQASVVWRAVVTITCLLLLIVCLVWTVTESNSAYLLGVPLFGYGAWLAVVGTDD